MTIQWRGWLASAAMVFAVNGAAEAGFDRMVVFGDSLSDGGNVFQLTGGTFPPLPYFAGRVSNGPVAVERLAQQWGISLTPSLAGGSNYAYIGALGGVSTAEYPSGSGTVYTTENLDDPQYGMTFLRTGTSVASQVQTYLGSHPTFDPATTLFTVWGGANDIFFSPTTANLTQAVGYIAGSVSSLVQAGARRILVPNLPDMGQIPYATLIGANQGLTAASIGFNDGLELALQQIEAANAHLTDLHLYRADVFGALHDLIASPPDGLNVTDACVVPGVSFCGPAADHYLFWDQVHPSAVGHERLATIFAQAVPEPSTYALMVLGGGMILLAARRRSR